jgi:hypothetical protein
MMDLKSRGVHQRHEIREYDSEIQLVEWVRWAPRTRTRPMADPSGVVYCLAQLAQE